MEQLIGGLALCGVGALASACAPLADAPSTTGTATTATEEPLATVEGDEPTPHVLPTEDGAWVPPMTRRGDVPAGQGTVDIRGIDTFAFDAGQVATVRPEIFQPGHFSLFDVLVHLDQRGDITLDYHFAEEADTHIIEAINGEGGWDYTAYYSSGWPERNAFRMDMYPYKNNTHISLTQSRGERQEMVYQTFRQEVERLRRNAGQVIVPDVTIRSPGKDWHFQDLRVTPHDVRRDVLQPGVVTALDALISLREQGKLPTLKLTWYERIGRADPVDSYWVEQVGPDPAAGGCGFVYETGSKRYPGFSGSHIHIPADVRVTISPEYALWFWICL